MDVDVSETADHELLARVRAGHADAFGVLFERHHRTIYNFCFRRTGDWSVAEECTSVVFLEAWRRRADVRPGDGSLRPWLLGVATNVLRNRGRSYRRHRAALDRLPPPSVEPDFADELAGRLDDERRMRALLALVSRLPRREQEVVALCAWQRLSYEEAAVAIGVPVGTVRSRLSRGRARLAELERELGRGRGQQVGERHPALRPGGERE